MSGYLFAFVRSPFLSLIISSQGQRARLYPAVNDCLSRERPLPVPPLAEQERIVKLLDEADELRKLRTQADNRMIDLIPALFNEMFGKPGNKDWHKHRLGDTDVLQIIDPWGLSLGDEEIVWGDKVILTRNGRKNGWNGKTKEKVEKISCQWRNRPCGSRRWRNKKQAAQRCICREARCGFWIQA